MIFDRSLLQLKSIRQRVSDLDLNHIMPLEKSSHVHPALKTVASKIRAARKQNAAVVLMMGAHVIRAGVQRYLIDLMEKGLISCIAMNGAGMIHDFEYALIGQTTESVAHYIQDGHFGLWRETGHLNDIVAEAAQMKIGLGSAVGKAIDAAKFDYRDISLLANAYRLNVPVTVHVSIGCDIVHEFPNCNGATYGETSYTDFLKFAGVLEQLEGGVIMNFGSAVMAPEIYLKALAMVRNVARQDGRTITRFTSLVCDLVDLPENYCEAPSKADPRYYFRPWKTMLVRTTANGGESFYVKGRHEETIPQLWTGLIKNRGHHAESERFK